MNAKRFVALLKQLGYTPHNAHELLGISRASVFRYANGESEIPFIVIKLLDMYLRFGVPKEHKQ
jgi:hypothetical protein